MASLIPLAMLMLAIANRATCNWCVCNPSLPEASLQKTLDYACGTGADCNPIHQNGACFLPDTVKSHCNYAVNSFFQRKGQAQGTCDFTGTAMVTTSDPSYTGCSFPSSLGASGTTTTPVTSTGGTSTRGTGTPTSTGPYTFTPNSGINGVGPTSVGTNTDYSDGGERVSCNILLFLCSVAVLMVI